MDTLLLARLQFSVTASIHFMFVSLTLSLVIYLAIMQTAWVVTGKSVYERAVKFWGRLYVVNYGLGLITGIVMEFQLGMGWSGLTTRFGDLLGPALAVETLVAFTLEVTLLGLWIFGWGTLGKKTHLVVIWLVALTAYASVLWILAANAFLQNPVGHQIRDGRAHLVDVGALLSNPSLWDAAAHVFFAALTVGSVFVAGISAYHFIKRTTETELFGKSLRLSLLLLPVAAYATVHYGMMQILVIGKTQPLKLALIEGASAQADALRDQLSEQIGPGHFLAPDWVTTLFSVMQGAGFALVLISTAGAILLIRNWVIRLRVPLYLLVALIPVPFAIVVVGWLVREIGRQPWTVYGQLLTAEAVSDLSPVSVTVSFPVFTLVLVTLAVLDYRLLAAYAKRGPQDDAFGARFDSTADDSALTPL
ncbi:cytochrome ubiquinol oxidase subunit I [Thermostaphylospora chromogena]|uniref:Cytochrome d ubiquinol oxidase subunit I n=1 Tax=Thermostaphylospora chromogena TaxID=35622 RepID=A0A1H1D091_9ACTN|nr:cytochrome ubiquinol oxidase subunit I [Thermostaphylospora chromogena]SDQ69884.1 cytochrome d ubiquinol oxidase subunit I [Thermostaphylospora chromogena]